MRSTSDRHEEEKGVTSSPCAKASRTAAAAAEVGWPKAPPPETVRSGDRGGTFSGVRAAASGRSSAEPVTDITAVIISCNDGAAHPSVQSNSLESIRLLVGRLPVDC